MSGYLKQLFPDFPAEEQLAFAESAEIRRLRFAQGGKTVQIEINIQTVDRSQIEAVSRFLRSKFGGYEIEAEYTHFGAEFNSDCFFYLLDRMGANGVNPGMFHKQGVKVSQDSILLPVSVGAAEILQKLGFESRFNLCCRRYFGRSFSMEYFEQEFEGDEQARSRKIAEFKERSAGPLLPESDLENFPVALRTREYVKIAGKRPSLRSITAMSEMAEEPGWFTVWGEVFKADPPETRRNGKSYTIWLTDYTSSVKLRQFFPVKGESNFRGNGANSDFIVNGSADRAFASIKKGDVLVVRGEQYEDKRGELQFRGNGIIKVFPERRTDGAAEKRVELHLHTQMSALDAIPEAEDAIRLAQSFGHRAVAITDHGVAQAFPDAQKAWQAAVKSDPDFKVIYGMEGYYVNDTGSVAKGMDVFELSGETVVFDVETTGLNAARDRITQIGAVIVKGGEVAESFCTLVDPEQKLSDEIVRLTGITNEMLEGAPGEKQALERFFEFAAGRPLAAHNAEFDISFVRAAARRCALDFEPRYIDTLELCQRLFPDEKRHRLDSMAKLLEVRQIQHHRADDDARTLAEIYIKLLALLREKGVSTGGQLNDALASRGYKHQHPAHIILLVKNRAGLKNLYRLISKSNLEYFYQKPRIPRTELIRHREGLIIGSACVEGELMQAVLDSAPEERLLQIASFYDYLEIQPIDNNSFLVEEGRLSSDEELRNLNRRVVELGEKLGKPVVATGDVHYLEQRDSLFRRIVSMNGGDRRGSLYFKTTGEMLQEFSYLGEQKAFEVVVANTNKIADMVESGILPIPAGTYAPKIEGAENRLNEYVKHGLNELCGERVPRLITDRANSELSSIIKNGFAGLYVTARRLVERSEKDGYHVGSRGSVGSSFVAFLCGITEVNPLPPHYRCKNCKHIEFVEGEAESGFDLPDRDCPECGQPMMGDGQDIPFETFLGFHGEKAPDIDLNFSSEYQQRAHRYVEELFGRENVFKAGTISLIKERKAYGYVKKYCEENGISAPPAEMERLVVGCTGVKQTTGQHPGGMVVVPREYDINDFTPVQHPADLADKGMITTHFDFHPLHDTLLKLDMLGHEVPTMYKYLEDFTGINVNDVPMNDPNVLRMFTSVEPLGIKPEDIDSGIGTFGIPEMGTAFVSGLLLESNPQTFADLLQVSGLSHGTNVWNGNAQDLIKQGVCTIGEVIGTRDSIMVYLMKKGVAPETAFEIMEITRKGKAAEKFTPEHLSTLKSCGVPDWYIESCKKISYMFPKAHAAAYVISAIRLAWFKLYWPVEFYATYFTVRGNDVDIDAALSDPASAKRALEKLRRALQLEDKNAPKSKEGSEYVALQMVCEALCRGVKFLPIDFYRSDARLYRIEGGALRLPFVALKGVGDAAADALMEAAGKKRYLSLEELIQEPGVNRSTVNALYDIGAFGNMPRSNQVSLFEI